MSVKRMIIGLLVAGALVGCGKTDRTTRGQVVEYFYGSASRGGHMVTSWESAKREDSIEIKRVICNLDDSWEYFDEDLNIVDIGDHEYFARYSVTFKKGEVLFERTEASYFCSETEWDAIPLTVEHVKINLRNNSRRQLKYEALWNGGFDAVDERYRTQ